MSQLTESVAVLWFRRDLRVDDHPLLAEALKHHSFVLPFYCFESLEFAPSSWGFSKTGGHRKRFLRESVEALREACRERGSELWVRGGNTADQLAAFAAETGAKTVYAQELLTPEERKVAAAVQTKLPAHCRLKLSPTSSLLHKDDLPFEVSQLPEVFTAFRKKVEGRQGLSPRAPIAPPAHLPLPKAELPSAGAIAEALQSVSEEPECSPHPKAVLEFYGGEKAAHQRLQHYFWKSRELRRYKETRNGLLGADYSSKFSPWLADGSLSPRRVFDEVRRFENEVVANESTYWLIFELLWRDHFHFLAEKVGPGLFRHGGWHGRQAPRGKDESCFEQWRQGRTGQPFVDANMRELAQTGFMSNRGRQNVASFWVHDLGQDWRRGASWFEHCLIDYDPCSNWGNWAYIAGVGSDPRGGRAFNVATQAQRYDPEGAYQRFWQASD
jgi:deoxyribodipyrimidine photo-lyase